VQSAVVYRNHQDLESKHVDPTGLVPRTVFAKSPPLALTHTPWPVLTREDTHVVRVRVVIHVVRALVLIAAGVVTVGVVPTVSRATIGVHTKLVVVQVVQAVV
jgi:hypothetical protein